MSYITKIYGLSFSLLVITFMGCSDSEGTAQNGLKNYISKHKVGTSPDYAIVKNGNDYVATVHGYVDDKKVCSDLINSMNNNPELSSAQNQYSCVSLNN